MNASNTIVWEMPYPALDENGNEYTANVRCEATAKDCINIRRQDIQNKNLTDEDLLDEFIVVNWAWHKNEEL